MFTGIVLGTGRVKRLSREGGAWKLEVEMEWAEKAKVGDSVCVNGVCLTAVESTGNRCTFCVVEETLKRTNLSLLRVGEEVNIELALGAGDRFGGHFVTGHVDGVGRIKTLKRREGQWDLVVECGEEMLYEMVERGSVAVDGISLTVAEIGESWFRVAIVPHTIEVTNLKNRRAGDVVNIETDILAKYIKRLLAKYTRKNELTEQKLREMGY